MHANVTIPIISAVWTFYFSLVDSLLLLYLIHHILKNFFNRLARQSAVQIVLNVLDWHKSADTSKSNSITFDIIIPTN